MITVIISAPQGVGKSCIARYFAIALSKAGFTNFKIFTTNETVVTEGMNEEEV